MTNVQIRCKILPTAFLTRLFLFFSSSLAPSLTCSANLGEPQEECIRCSKMYILTSDTNKGLCCKCLGIPRDQMKPFRSSSESGTEEEMDEEELSNGGTEFSDK